MNYHVDVISPHPNYPQKSKYNKLSKLIYKDNELNVTYLPIFIPEKDSLIKRFLSYMSYTTFSFFYSLFFLKKYDLIISSSPPIFTSFAASLVAKIKRTKFIWDIRDFWPEIGVELGILKDPLMIKILYRLERKILKSSTSFIVTSERSKNYLIKREIDSDSIYVAYNGADTKIFKPSSIDEIKKIRNKIKIGENRLLLTYFGSFNSGMNDIFTLANSLSKLDKFKDQFCFILIGDGYNKKEFLEIIGNNIDFIDLGTLYGEEISKYLSACDLSIIPRKSLNNDLGGNIPVKCFESWACGVPVLLSSDSETEITQIFKECNAGFLVPPSSTESLSDKLIEIITGNYDLKEMGNRGRELVEKKYDRKIQAYKLVDAVKRSLE
jgi:glycosyltransferase involved in cell wall biosynthesis